MCIVAVATVYFLAFTELQEIQKHPPYSHNICDSVVHDYKTLFPQIYQMMN